MKSRYVLFALLGSVLIALDQLTKWWIYANVEYGRGRIPIIPGLLEIVHVQNRGAAFGMLGGYDHRMLVFLGFTVVAVAVLVWQLKELTDQDRFLTVTLAMILAGALGNGIDRAWKQSVTDFVRIYTENPKIVSWLGARGLPAEWPSWNVADACIVMGVIFFFIHSIFLQDRGVQSAVLRADELPEESPG